MSVGFSRAVGLDRVSIIQQTLDGSWNLCQDLPTDTASLIYGKAVIIILGFIFMKFVFTWPTVLTPTCTPPA